MSELRTAVNRLSAEAATLLEPALKPTMETAWLSVMSRPEKATLPVSDSGGTGAGVPAVSTIFPVRSAAPTFTARFAMTDSSTDIGLQDNRHAAQTGTLRAPKVDACASYRTVTSGQRPNGGLYAVDTPQWNLSIGNGTFMSKRQYAVLPRFFTDAGLNSTVCAGRFHALATLARKNYGGPRCRLNWTAPIVRP